MRFRFVQPFISPLSPPPQFSTAQENCDAGVVESFSQPLGSDSFGVELPSLICVLDHAFQQLFLHILTTSPFASDAAASPFLGTSEPANALPASPSPLLPPTTDPIIKQKGHPSMNDDSLFENHEFIKYLWQKFRNWIPQRYYQLQSAARTQSGSHVTTDAKESKYADGNYASIDEPQLQNEATNTSSMYSSSFPSEYPSDHDEPLNDVDPWPEFNFFCDLCVPHFFRIMEQLDIRSQPALVAQLNKICHTICSLFGPEFSETFFLPYFKENDDLNAPRSQLVSNVRLDAINGCAAGQRVKDKLLPCYLNAYLASMKNNSSLTVDFIRFDISLSPCSPSRLEILCAALKEWLEVNKKYAVRVI